MIKYRTGGWGNNMIESVEVVKETDKQLVIKESDFSGRSCEARVSKLSQSYQFHDTWDSAHAYLLKKAEERVESCRLTLERAKGTFGNIKGLKRPEEP